MTEITRYSPTSREPKIVAKRLCSLNCADNIHHNATAYLTHTPQHNLVSFKPMIHLHDGIPLPAYLSI